MGVVCRATIEERIANAATRWDFAVARQTSGRGLVVSSRWLVVSSRATLDRQRPAIQGGADDRGLIEERLRALIAGGTLPSPIPRRMFVGKCREAHPCVACSLTIEPGDAEFEWTNPGGFILYFHRLCVEVYRRLSNGEATR